LNGLTTLTPSQTIGPFLHIEVPYEGEERLVDPNHPGAIRLLGAITDGEGNAVADALVEIWQANSAGRYAHPEDDREDVPLEDGFTGFGRCATDAEGRFEFVTVKPGPVPGPDDRLQAPHIDVSVFARGLLNRLVTRIYFPDEAEANAGDPVLALIEDEAERQTLIAGQEDGALRFDIRLQGEGETAFFAI
jgi:protocatechuate 3,4-dioxygenase alpha subunit